MRTPVQTTTIVQPTVVATVTTGAPTRLLTPVLQSNNTLTRNTGSQVRPTGPQITNPIAQPIRHQPQTIQVFISYLIIIIIYIRIIIIIMF